jgi:pyruvate, water dikinase
MKVALSVGIQKMVRSDKASAGVAFTLDPDSGNRNVIMIDGAWGLGENIVQGKVLSDEFYLFKEALRNNRKAIVSKRLGSKLVFAGKKKDGKTIRNKETPRSNDDELEKLGRWCLQIEELYGKPMDIEWAKDGDSNEIFIVQARLPFIL